MAVPGGDPVAAARNALATTAPVSRLGAIAPANSDLTEIPNCLYIGGAGNLVIVAVDDVSNTGTTLAVAAGAFIPIRARRILPASTATGIIGLYS